MTWFTSHNGPTVGGSLDAADVPELSRFYGIVVRMFFGDHPPPHVHVRYAEHKARVRLDGSVIDGSLPIRALAMLREWMELHRGDLAASWDRASRNEPPGRIDPLP